MKILCGGRGSASPCLHPHIDLDRYTNSRPKRPRVRQASVPYLPACSGSLTRYEEVIIRIARLLGRPQPVHPSTDVVAPSASGFSGGGSGGGASLRRPPSVEPLAATMLSPDSAPPPWGGSGWPSSASGNTSPARSIPSPTRLSALRPDSPRSHPADVPTPSSPAFVRLASVGASSTFVPQFQRELSSGLPQHSGASAPLLRLSAASTQGPAAAPLFTLSAASAQGAGVTQAPAGASLVAFGFGAHQPGQPPVACFPLTRSSTGHCGGVGELLRAYR